MKKAVIIVFGVVMVALAGIIIWSLLASIRTNVAILSLPSAHSSIKVSFVDEKLARMSLREKVASLFILHTPGTDAANLRQYLQTYQPGGLIFMGDNIPVALTDLTTLTGQLQTNSGLPYLFAIDEEGGVVKRLEADNFPAAADLKSQPPSLSQPAFRSRSVMLKKVGMNLNFGIVADVTYDTNSFIYSRVFGGDPVVVGERVAAAVDGANGLTLSTLKHFPGHGETTFDSHFSIPVTDISYASWQQRDEPPFVSGLKAGAQVVMFGHLVYSSVDSLPASLSAKWHNILREHDGFTGLTITDDMMMLQQSGDPNYVDPVKNAISALQAGNTMLLFVLDHDGYSNIDPNVLIDGVVDAVKNGELSQKTINNNVRQVLTLRHSLPILLTSK